MIIKLSNFMGFILTAMISLFTAALAFFLTMPVWVLIITCLISSLFFLSCLSFYGNQLLDEKTLQNGDTHRDKEQWSRLAR